MNKILLSVCIATYNQPKEVDRLLQALVPQLTPEAEILIKDDSPNTDTEVVVRKHNTHGTIRYIGGERDEEKIKSLTAGRKKGQKGGLDRAIIFLTEEARGEYVWWLGDDVVEKGAIAAMIEVIKRNPHLNFLLVNFQTIGSSALAFPWERDRWFTNQSEVLEEAVGVLGFISATVFRRTLALTGIQGSQKYIGSAFVNLYLVLHVLSQGGGCYFLKGPYLINHPTPQEKVNDNGFEVFGVNFFNIVSEFKNKFDKKSVRRILSKNFSCVWRGVLVRWVTGYESPKGKRWQMVKLYWSFPELWFGLPAFILPLWLNKQLYKTYKIFFKDRKWVGLKRMSKNGKDSR